MLKVTKPARRKCAICQEWFIPRFQNERWCCPEHGAKLAIQLREREKAKAEQRLKKEKEVKRKESSARIRKRKEEIKPLSKLTKEAQAAFNKYIRIRDSGQPCISCQAHAIEFARERSSRDTARKLPRIKVAERQAEKAKAASHRKRKLEVNRTQHLDRLQKLVNQWVLSIRDANEPCCTCGTANPGIKYDAGHFLSRGSSPELRFEVTNIHRQCSVQCNGHKSGAKAEYIQFIIAKYGQAHYDWLCGPHPKLKDQLPDADAIELEIAKYRKLIRDAGLKPAT